MAILAPPVRTAVLVAGLAAAALALLWLVDARVGRLWLNTALLAGGACLIALPLGTTAAIAIFKTDVPGRRFAALLLVAMLFVPLFLVTGAWDAGFGMQGWHTIANNPHLAHEPWLSGWRAAIWVHALAAVPWVALIIGAGLRSVEAELEEDAATCASPLQVLWHVSLPRSAAAIAVAALWVAIVAATEISVTDFFQVRTFAEEVYTQSALGAFDAVVPTGEAAAPLSTDGLWAGLLVSTLLSLVVILAALQFVTDLADMSTRPTWFWRLKQRWPATAVLWSIMLLVAGVPFGNFIYKAGIAVTTTDSGRVRHWSAAKFVERVAAAPGEFRGELETSGAIGAAAATAALAVGLPLAWTIREKRGRTIFPRRAPIPASSPAGKISSEPFVPVPWVRFILLALCFVIPGPLLGMGLIHVLNQPPDSPLAPLARLYDSMFAPWLAQTLRALPMVTLILWAALATVPQATLDAAATDGAGWWGQLLRIAAPQRWPAVIAAWLIGLAIAVGELAATVLVMPPAQSTTISVRIFQLLHYGVDDRVAAISLVLVAAIATLTAIASALFSRAAAK